MKKFLLSFAEGYFVVSIILYIATYMIMKNPINTLFYPETCRNRTSLARLRNARS